MLLSLDYKIEIDVKEGGKSKEKLKVFVREFTKQESREHRALEKKFRSLLSRLQKIGSKQSVIEKKISLFEEAGRPDDALKEIVKQEELAKELDGIQEEIEEIGGDDFAEDASEKRFEMLVSGSDKEKLSEISEIKGYSEVMRLLDAEKKALEKKQSGE